ncbi:hypothetical protein D3C76_38100 [compost metagenome]
MIKVIFKLGISLYMMLVFLIVLCSFPEQAHAGLWNDIKNGYHTITGLPEEVDELKENYQATMDKLEKTQSMAENLQKQNEQLMAENTRQSEQLSEALNTLQEAEKQKESRFRKIRVTLYTGGILLVGYFCSIRIIRLILRRKSLDRIK